jgi:hypothetical protein
MLRAVPRCSWLRLAISDSLDATPALRRELFPAPLSAYSSVSREARRLLISTICSRPRPKNNAASSWVK